MKIIKLNSKLVDKYKNWIVDYIYKSMNRGCDSEWFSKYDASAKTIELKSYLSENKAYSFIAEEDYPIGFIWAYPFGEEGEVYLSIIYVGDECRGAGVGKRLIATLEKTVKKEGYKRIWLHTDANNKQSRAFYSKVGYDEERIQLSKEI